MKEKISRYMDIKRVEFTVTHQCGGKCRHCQSGSSINKRGTHRHVLAEYAVDAIEKLSTVFDITSVMTFGGEPLYYPDVTAAIHRKAADCGIETREIITNGYFTNSAEKSKRVALSLLDAGINALFISADALHQEFIPIEPVYRFAADVAEAKIPGAFLHPAWVVDKHHSNPYNDKTREILARFSDLPIAVGSNTVDLNGRAAQFLAEYYPERQPLSLDDPDLSTPCAELANVQGFGIEPNGNVACCGFVLGNIYTEDILDIVRRYSPYENEGMMAVINGGVAGLHSYAEKQGVHIDISKFYSACWDACGTIAGCLSSKI